MNSFTSLLKILERMNEQGCFDVFTDETFSRFVDGLITAWIKENAMGYTEAAAKLGITKNYLEKIISENNIKPLHIKGIKQNLLLKTQITGIARILKKNLRYKQM